MSIPNLNRRLVLEDAYRAPDGSGGYTTVWQGLGTLWAEITAGAGRELARHELARSQVTLKAVIRSAPVGSPARPHAGQRFREGTRIYAIEAVAERDHFARYLVCHLREEVAA